MAKYVVQRGSMHERIHQSRSPIQIIGGGFGNGKTAAGVVKALQLVKYYPGCNGLIAMATYAQLNDTIREEVYKWTPPSSVKRYPTIADNTLLFKNGSKINFRYVKQKGKAAAADGHTSSNLLSATYDWACIDQLENPEITYKDYLDVLGRLRGTTAYVGNDDTMPRTGPRWLFGLVNPSFNWVYHKLIRPYYHYKTTGLKTHPDLPVDADGNVLLEVIEGSTYENAHNLPPDFIARMEASYKGQFRERYIGGTWGAFEGLVYPDFSMERHVISKTEIMKLLIDMSYSRVRPTALEGFDFGIASPSCYMLGFVDFMGRVFIIDGFYSANLSLAQIASKISDIKMRYGGYLEFEDPIHADPAIFKKTIVRKEGSASDTIASILSEDYNIDMIPGQNDIMNGIAKVSSYFAVEKFGAEEGSAIYVCDQLSWFFDEIQSYFWQMDKGFERTDKPTDRNDHAMDTLKYMFSELPEVRDLLYKQQVFDGRMNQWLAQKKPNITLQRH